MVLKERCEMKHTEGNSLEIAGVLIAIGFVAAWLAAGGLGIKNPSVWSYSILPTWSTAVDISAERPQQHVPQPTPRNVLPLPLMIVKGEITARNPNALEAKHALQRRLEALDSYVSQLGGLVTLGDVRYIRDKKTTESGAFVMVQQIEIRLPDSPSDSAYEHKLVKLGVKVNSVERSTQTSEAK